MMSVVETTDKATLDIQYAIGVDYGIHDAVVVAAAGEGSAADDRHCHRCCCCQRKTLLSFIHSFIHLFVCSFSMDIVESAAHFHYIKMTLIKVL
jgi:hypothetical protein